MDKSKKTSTGKNYPIIIYDDHIAIRKGLTEILEERGFSVAGTCFHVDELLKLIHASHNAIVITDLAVDEIPLQNLIDKIKKVSPGSCVIVYSMRETSATIALCYKAGAIAFVPKSTDPDDIAKAIECASKGERYFPPVVAAELANLKIDSVSPSDILTKTELPVFVEYCKLGEVKAVADALEMTERNVQNTLSRVAKRLDVPRSRFHHVAEKYGLISKY